MFLSTSFFKGWNEEGIESPCILVWRRGIFRASTRGSMVSQGGIPIASMLCVFPLNLINSNALLILKYRTI